MAVLVGLVAASQRGEHASEGAERLWAGAAMGRVIMAP